jgi:L,D-peptidoglycan transpeptidase YkuD (ErfK/YbiS/YcfS/YnhG family)
MRFDRAAAPNISSQILSVSTVGSAATIRCLEKTRRGGWKNVRSLGDLRGFVGRNGITADKRELDGYTPAGMYWLGSAFGVRPRPETRMPWRQVTPDSVWVDDSNSPYYNQWVEAPVDAGWSSAEHLIDYPLEYAYAVVVEYNTKEIVPGKGSAIFLHCGSHPTSGCIAVKEPDLLAILRWLDPEKLPEIFIHPR